MSLRTNRTRGAKTAALASFATVLQAENEPDIVEDIMAVAPIAKEPVDEEEVIAGQAKTPEELKPVFTSFTTTSKLDEGLSIIRSLGGGKFEIVNLKSVDARAISSEETGAMIKNTAGMLEMVDFTEKDWDDAKFKCGQAASAANGTIFRFQKLPVELRFKIYEFMVISPVKLRHSHSENPTPNKDLGLGILQTCKEIYSEASQFFFKNEFHLTDITAEFKAIAPVFLANIREVSFQWWGWAIKDPNTLQWISRCSKLKVLHIHVTRYATDEVAHHRRQYLYQNEESIKKFRKSNGFDALTRIRGLDRVSVIPHSKYPPGEKITKEEMDDFQAFLARTLTLPKLTAQPSIPAQAIKKKPAKTAKRKVKKEDIERWN